jgi:hypothetical protein
MYRTILLAYDGSRQGREALDQGARLARLCQARVCLLAVVAHKPGVALAEAAAYSDVPQREYQEVRGVLMAGAENASLRGQPRRTDRPNGPRDRRGADRGRAPRPGRAGPVVERLRWCLAARPRTLQPAGGPPGPSGRRMIEAMPRARGCDRLSATR